MNLEFEVWIDGKQSVATHGNAAWSAVSVPAGPQALSIVPAYCAGRALEVKSHVDPRRVPTSFSCRAEPGDGPGFSHRGGGQQDRDRHHYSAAHGPAGPQFKFAAQVTPIGVYRATVQPSSLPTQITCCVRSGRASPFIVSSARKPSPSGREGQAHQGAVHATAQPLATAWRKVIGGRVVRRRAVDGELRLDDVLDADRAAHRTVLQRGGLVHAHHHRRVLRGQGDLEVVGQIALVVPAVPGDRGAGLGVGVGLEALAPAFARRRQGSVVLRRQGGRGGKGEQAKGGGSGEHGLHGTLLNPREFCEHPSLRRPSLPSPLLRQGDQRGTRT